jgi:hypothetical protein
MTLLYYYQAYSLPIVSELEFPEFLPAVGDAAASGEPPVTICYGAVPTELAHPTGRGVLYQASANQFLLKMDGVARYLVRNGHEIVVEPAAGSLASDVRVFLLGSCLGALLHQRGVLVLHASGIGGSQGAFLFTGPSGIGKSTLLGELLRRGHKMLVDDVCAVTPDSAGYPVVQPAYPRTRLWADSASKLTVETAGLDRTRPDMEKYERQIPAQFWDQPAPLRRIYHLATTNQDELRLAPLPRIQTFSAVLHNTYRHVFLDGLEMRQSHFDLVAAVASQVGVTRVVRPSGVFKLVELADLIEQDMGAL